jgi:hypothetical protein
MKSIFVIFILLASFASVSEAASLSCKKVRSDGEMLFHIENEKGQHMGVEDTSGYFEDAKECDRSLALSKNQRVCLWNRGSWKIFDGNTKEFFNVEYAKLEDCGQITWYSGNTGICYQQDNEWKLFAWKTSKTLSRSYKSLQECGNFAVAADSSSHVCVPSSDRNWFLIYSTIEDSYLQTAPFSEVSTCEAAIKSGQNISTELDETLAELSKPFTTGPNEKVGFTYQSCSDPDRRFHIIKQKNGKIDKACIPDTFYSWGDFDKIAWYKQNMGDGKWIGELERPLFTTQSPVGTFAYGNVSMRIKIKATTKVKYIEGSGRCEVLTKKEKQDTMLIRYFTASGDNNYTGVDYIFCSTGPIESWSFGTRAHYDEIVRDYVWIENHNFKDYELYIKDGGVDKFIGLNIDAHDFTEEKLQGNLNLHRQMANLRAGKVFYAPGADQNPDSHFMTRKPIYYNWKTQ